MHLFLDARFYGTEHTGLGRYTKNVLDHLPSLINTRVTVLVHPRYQDLKFGRNWHVITSTVRPYSLLEQFMLPYLIHRHRADLYFAFHFNVPLLTPIPFEAVVHDLIKSFSQGPDTTTRAPWLYWLKRLGYELTMRRTVTRAKALIVPTNTVKNDLLATYNLEPSRLHVIPEAIDPGLQKLKILNSIFKIPRPYLLFVGNAYPHKNLPVLLTAMGKLPHNLVLVSQRTSYLTRLLAELEPGIKVRLYLRESVNDQELAALYRRAVVTIMPSLMEGYGLPGVESLALGTPVVAADIPVFREVYGTRAVYFSPASPASLAHAVNTAARIPRRRDHPHHTWSDTAESIAKVIHAHRSGL